MKETVTKTHEQIVHDLTMHLEFFAICPCCSTKPIEYTLIPRARMTLIELSCYGCSFTGQVKVRKYDVKRTKKLCRYCDKVFTHWHALQKHRARVHAEEIQRY